MLTKTNYIVWRECKKNAWLKIHKPEIYFAHELSTFEKQIIETGNEVDILARDLFPAGEYQKEFKAEGFLAITDILSNGNIYEVKATNEIDKKTHLHDLAFQYNVLKLSRVEVKGAYLVHLNPDYVRKGELEITKVFAIEDLTEVIREMADEVLEEMRLALEYVENKEEPKGPCDCIYKGRSAHCTTFHYSNPEIPEYGVHDIVRIGLSKRKLLELVDGHKFKLEDVPEGFELSDAQKNQIWTHLTGREIISKPEIKEELDKLVFPLYFLDYETFPAAIPRYDGFTPYTQIPFQYSLHVLKSFDEEPEHKEFLWTENSDPSRAIAESLVENLPGKGSVIVWHKDFECGRNRELGIRIPEFKNFFDEVEKRIFDLETIFKKQYYVHKDFYGSTSIKYVLPVLTPELRYDTLAIREGGTASERWNHLVTQDLDSDPTSLKLRGASEKELIIENLKAYCKLDTYAMYAIWKKLYELI